MDLFEDGAVAVEEDYAGMVVGRERARGRHGPARSSMRRRSAPGTDVVFDGDKNGFWAAVGFTTTGAERRPPSA